VAVHINTQTIHRTTQIITNVEECGPCPVFASFTLGFALQLRKKHGKTSVRVRKTCQVRKILSQSTVYILPKHPHITKPSQTHTLQNNKLIYIVSSCWLFSQLYHDARIHEHQVRVSCCLQTPDSTLILSAAPSPISSGPARKVHDCLYTPYGSAV